MPMRHATDRRLPNLLTNPLFDFLQGVEDAHDEEAVEEEDVYRQWLRRQYGAYTSALLSVLTSDAAPAGLQVCHSLRERKADR